MPRTAQRIVNELHTLLTNARTKGPYVLVGHSFGGLAVRLYAAQYPEEVVGMVLVDPAHPSQWLQITEEPTLLRARRFSILTRADLLLFGLAVPFDSLSSATNATLDSGLFFPG